MLKRINVGYEDFKRLIDRGCYYVDKSLFVRDIIQEDSSVMLFTRPRRFGKTLNMSMLYYFLSNTEKSKKLFMDLNIGKEDNGQYFKYLNKYPTIYITLKDLKNFRDYDMFLESLGLMLAGSYEKYRYLLNSNITDIQRQVIGDVLCNRASEATLLISLKILSEALYEQYKQRVYIIIDEYDASLTYAWLNGLYDEVLEFMKGFLGSALKSNMALEKGILTGVLRVSKENLFSDLNNIMVYDITKVKYSNYFGFTSEEVRGLLAYYGIEKKFNVVKKWYDGYLFGNTTIFNPWSILNYLQDEAHIFSPYWANTGSNELLKKIIYNYHNDMIRGEFYELLETGILENVVIDYTINLDSVNVSRDAIWTLFMASGYLKPSKQVQSNLGVTLEIPNWEVKLSLEGIVVDWFKETYKRGDLLVNSLLNNDVNGFARLLVSEIEDEVSYFDVPINTREIFYHGFILGLLGRVRSYYDISSNRESGLGRYDVLLKPKRGTDSNLYIMEFKVIGDKDSFGSSIRKGFKQIKDKKYDAPFNEYNVVFMVIVFRGKEVRVEYK